jgi:hypothetical protein
VLVVLERISSGFAGFGVVVVVVVEPVAVVVAVVDGLTVALVVTPDVVIVVVVLVAGEVVTEVVVPQATVMSERATSPTPIRIRHRIDLPDSQFFIFLLNILLGSVQKKGRP